MQDADLVPNSNAARITDGSDYNIGIAETVQTHTPTRVLLKREIREMR